MTEQQHSDRITDLRSAAYVGAILSSVERHRTAQREVELLLGAGLKASEIERIVHRG
jgi:hypothetical protein